MKDFFLTKNTDFVPFSHQHLIVVLFFILFGFLLISFAKKQNQKNKILIGNIFALAISVTIVISIIVKTIQHGFNYQEDLPLHLCRLIGLLIPIFSFTRKYFLYEILIFFILAGTSQAIFTPDDQNYLNFFFFRYWFLHAGLVVYIIYATIIYEMQPRIKSVFKAFLFLQVYILSMYLLNNLLGSNYFYTNRKPNATTLLDLFGDWPQYIFVVELLLIPLFLLIYLPFYLANKKEKIKL